MKSTGGRIAVVIGVIAVAVVAFLILRPTAEDEGGVPASQQAGGDTEGQDGSSGPKRDRDGGRKPKPRPAATEIEVKNGEPVGGVASVEVEKGDDVELVVDSDVDEEVHVHGYDEFQDVGPGKPARLEFAADIEGVFEVELEHSHVQIARLEVRP